MSIIENIKKQVTAVPRVLFAGVAQSEITTNEPGVMVNDPLYAKALGPNQSGHHFHGCYGDRRQKNQSGNAAGCWRSISAGTAETA